MRAFAFLLLTALVLVWFERRVVAFMQNRIGPLHTGQSGILQPVADIIKLCSKEDIVPEKADKKMFAALPVFALAIVLTLIKSLLAVACAKPIDC